MLRMLMIGLLAVASCFGADQGDRRHAPEKLLPRAACLASSNANVQGYNGIDYHGGPVMNDPHGTNVYFIWHGNWVNSPVPAIVTDFVKNIGGTAYFNMNSSYYDYNPGSGKDPVVNRINYGGSVFDNYSVGKKLGDQDLGTILESAVFSGKLPNDPKNGVYFILTSADVIETSGFCTQYCAFHAYDSLPNENRPVAFIGNPDQCSSFCTALSGFYPRRCRHPA
jgi:hypothetical protein